MKRCLAIALLFFLAGCAVRAANAPEFVDAYWIHLDSDWIQSSSDPGVEAASGKIARFESNGDFSLLECLLIRARNQVSVSQGDPIKVFIGRWSVHADGAVADYVKVYETIEWPKDSVPFKRRYSEPITIDRGALSLGETRFAKSEDFASPMHDRLIAGERRLHGAKVLALLDTP